MSHPLVNVLIVDDSSVARLMLTHILEADGELHVMAAVADGQEAVEFVQRQLPDVVLMDLQMPRMDGYEATRRIMEMRPVPIVVCSAVARPESVASMFRVMEAGALTCVQKPVGQSHPDFEMLAANLRQTIKLMAEVKVVRRWPRARSALVNRSPDPPRRRPAVGGVQIVGIGASTGGPQVLQQVLAALPKGFPAPILVVQHMSPGFLPGLAEWLNQTTGFRVQIGAYGVHTVAGHVYLAPDDFHMGVTASGQLRLTKEAPDAGLRPSVAYLFRSLAETLGPAAVGVLLTGMGKDGAAELKLMRNAGAHTIVQDQESSVVFGMPGEAVRLGGATQVLPSGRIADAIVSIVTNSIPKERHP